MSERRPISLALALVPLATLVACFAVGGALLGVGAEMLILSMLGAATVAGALAIRHGGSWGAIQESTGQKLAAVLPVVLILLAIGLLIGSWVLSGTIPMLISWGIRLVHPQFFVLTAFVTTVTFSGSGTFTGSMTPITEFVADAQVPAPTSLGLLLAGLALTIPGLRNAFRA